MTGKGGALARNCPIRNLPVPMCQVLWALDRSSFRMILLEANTKKIAQYESFLGNVQVHTKTLLASPPPSHPPSFPPSAPP